MFKVYADNVCIYDDKWPKQDRKASDPRLTMEDNAAGSFSMTMYENNPGYISTKILDSDITVVRENEELWWGRIIREEYNIYGDRKIECEGALAFFNDVTLTRPAEYRNHFEGPTGSATIALPTVEYVLNGYIRPDSGAVDAIGLLGYYNSGAPRTNGENLLIPPNRKVYIGNIADTTYDDSVITAQAWSTIWDSIRNCIIDAVGGHIRVRKVNGLFYLDYLTDFGTEAIQEVRFGKNLLSYTKKVDRMNYGTAIMPKSGNTTINSATHGSEVFMELHEGSISEHGYIARIIEVPDSISNPDILYNRSREYIDNNMNLFLGETYSLTAVDLHYIDPSIPPINLLDRVRVISPKHGLNDVFPVTRIEIPLATPERATISLSSNTETE